MRKRKSTSLIAQFAFVFAMLLIGACSEDAALGENDNTLSRGLNGDPESLDPQKFSSVQAGDVLRDIGEGLVTLSATGELTPGVAETWQISPDGSTYLFKIRENARWSTGEILSANDFVNSFRRAFDPKTASTNSGRLDAIKNAKKILRGELNSESLGIRAIDENLLEIRLEKPTPYFLSLLIHPGAFPLHRTAFGDGANSHPFRPGQYVSNGAYVLVNRTPGSEIVLNKNNHYWNATDVYFEVVKYNVVNPAREVVRYIAGDLDVTSNVDGDSFFAIAETRRSELRVFPKLGTYYYGFNLSKPPFKANAKLREALALAIDRQVIVESVTKRGEIPAFNFVPPGIDGYRSPAPIYSQMSQQQREARAKELYEQAGYSFEKPANFELRYNTGGGHEKIALAISAMWKSVLGVRVNLVKEEFGVFIENVISMHETEAFRLSWTADYNDAQSFLQLFESDNSNNLTAYTNREVDALLELGAHELDSEARLKLLQKAEELVLSEFPVIPIYFFVSKHLVAPHVCGWKANILDYHYSKTLRSCEE